MYIEKVLEPRVQLMKNGGKSKSVAFIILFSVFFLFIIVNKNKRPLTLACSILFLSSLFSFNLIYIYKSVI